MPKVQMNSLYIYHDNLIKKTMIIIWNKSIITNSPETLHLSKSKPYKDIEDFHIYQEYAFEILAMTTDKSIIDRMKEAVRSN